MINNIFCLTPAFSDKETSVITFFGHLVFARSYPASLIHPIVYPLMKWKQKCLLSTLWTTRDSNKDNLPSLILPLQEYREEQQDIVANLSTSKESDFSLISHSEVEEEIDEPPEQEDLHTAKSNKSSDKENEIEIVSAAMAKAKPNTAGADISEAVLEPIWGCMDVQDPDYPGQNKPRCCWVVRVNISSGNPLYSFTHNIVKDGQSVLTSSAGKDMSQFEASYCMGPNFSQDNQIMSSVQQALNEYLAKLTKH
jgi:hypothetical protein